MLLKQDENGQAQKQIANDYENSIVSQSKQEGSVPRQSANDYEDLIIEPPEQFRDRQKKRRPPKPNRKPPPIPLPEPEPINDFDDDIFQTENTSLVKFKIISIQSRQNKKFRSFTNEFKIKILKNWMALMRYIFQELIKHVKRKRKLSSNDRLRFVIQNEELPNGISTKFNMVQDFKLGDLEQVIRTLEYRDIPLEKCKIVVQSVKIPTGKGRLYPTKDTVSRKNCVITVKNDDTICLARAIVTAYANLKPERW